MVLFPMVLWSTTMEWFLLPYQSTWSNHQSALDPLKHLMACLTSRKIKTKYFYCFFAFSQHFSQTLKGQDGYMCSFFPHIHNINLQPSRGVHCVFQMFLHSALHSSLSFPKSLNQNVILRIIPFF